MSPDHPPGLDLERLREHARPRAARTGARAADRPADRGRPLEPHLRGHRRHRPLGGAPAAARPRARHRARHEARAPGDQRPAPHGRAGARAAAALRGRGGDRRAVLRHGVRRGHPVPHRRAARRRSAPSAPGRSCWPWWTPWSTCTRWTRPRSGSADFGRPEGFLDRQLRRWGKQLDASRSRELPGIDELHAALGRALPVSPAPDGRARRLPAGQRPDRRRTTGSARCWTGRCPRSAIR